MRTLRNLPRLLRLTAPPCLLAAVLAASGAPLGLLGGPAEPLRDPTAASGRAAAAAAGSASPTPGPSPRVEPVPSPSSSVSPRPKKAAPAKKPADRLALFRGLGAWIDLYDFELRPGPTVALMRRNGVRTLYIQTGRTNTRYAVDPRVGPWLAEAHAAGMKVVGWYLPYYADMDRDLRRTVAIARYRYQGHRFDGAGIDIEFRGAVESRARWMRRVAAHAKRSAAALGDFPLSSITPTPLQMRVAPGHWKGFPWKRLARATDAVLLMSYWSDRSGCPAIKRHCAYEFTALNVDLTRKLSASPNLLVHIIGGVGDSISGKQLRAFIRGARDAKANGASIYDVVTTKRSWWAALKRLSVLR